VKKNIYLLIAPGEFWLKPDVEQIQKKHGVDQDWEKRIFFGGIDEPEAIFSALADGSLFTTRRFFLIKNAIDYSADELAKLALRLSTATVDLLIVYYCRNLARKDRESKWYSAFQDVATVIDKSYPDQKILAEIIAGCLKELKKDFTEEVVAYLAERFSENADLLDSELKKIGLASPERISVQEIEKILAGSSQYTLNNLSEAVLSHRPQEALAILNHLCLSGEEPLRILESIDRVVRQLYRAKIKQGAGQSLAEIFRELKIYFFQQNAFRTGLEKFTIFQLTNALFFIWQTERKLKTSPIEPRWRLESLLIQLFSKQYRQQIIPEALRLV